MDIEKIRKEKPIQDLLNFSILNIDKPTGPTSFSVSDYIRHALDLSKTSHFGTLDPMVTGVLPVGLGRACRLSDYFMHRDKVYVGIMRLHKEVSEKDLRTEIEKFIGKINQLPPVRSRVKREIREREVKTFDILEIDGTDVLFSSKVQAGTYIRKLCDDIGKNLGGAHMLELRRTEAGLFKEPCYTLYDLDKAIEDLKSGNEKTIRDMLVPAEIISTLYPVVELNKLSLKQIKTGKPLFKKDIIGKFDLEEGDIFVGVCEGMFIGCYNVKAEDEIVARPGFIYN
ncbi:MAG TPA: RNA-guided pseudouridylation complex pseudouridine synthase subunit Cbf5 [Candidatus Nanoarchaeia archaeon]|nr:RNA-guided pseudouridylation complex pseudouridine synthase subunit Cbf5 [Candidatus Nanoarchaeia archaeon]